MNKLEWKDIGGEDSLGYQTTLDNVVYTVREEEHWQYSTYRYYANGILFHQEDSDSLGLSVFTDRVLDYHKGRRVFTTDLRYLFEKLIK